MNEKHPVRPVSRREAGEFYSTMVERVSDYAIFIMDPNGIIRDWNKAAEVMKGYTREEAIGSYLGMLYTDEERARLSPQINLKRATMHGTYQEETWRRRKSGALFWAMVEIISIKDASGQLTGFCKITRDISRRKELMDEIAEERERAQVTLRAIGDAVLAVSADGKIEYLNPKAEKLTGWTDGDARGRPFSQVFSIEYETSLRPDEHQLSAVLGGRYPIDHASSAVLVSRDGTRYAIEDTAAPIHVPGGGVAGGVIVFRDVSQSRELLKAVTHQASHDALTGLVNRIEFEKCLQRSLERAKQAATEGALLFMDLDQFKIVNDVCGHGAGDELLVQLANLYRSHIRERDILARLGGDEFALIADHCSPDEATTIANKIRAATREFQFVRGGRVFKVGVSIGLVRFDQHTHDGEELLSQADRACYVAKQSGRNRIVRHGVDDAVPAERRAGGDWALRLREAMQSNQLVLHYQAIATAQGEQAGLRFEILLRLLDPEQGVIMPNVFLPAAERFNLMPDIDRWVVKRVLDWLDAHNDSAVQVELCVIKLSAKTLSDASFLDDLGECLAEHTAPPDKLCFEIAGAAAVIDMQKSQATMAGLRKLGCKVALGGFGSGMVSLGYLKLLPADFLKIDGSFVSMITQSIVDEKMVASVNEIAHLMGQQTIAECVEDQATGEVLSRMGVDYLQGHWIGYPEELTKIELGVT